jgi:hypothetical protein
MKLLPFMTTEMEWVARNGSGCFVVIEQSWWRQKI